MASNRHITTYPLVISTVRTLVRFPITCDGTLKQVRMKTDIGPTVSGFVIQYKVDGVLKHTHTLGTVAPATPMVVNSTGLSIAVTEGQEVTILTSAVGSFASMGPRTYFQITVDDHEPLKLVSTSVTSINLSALVPTDTPELVFETGLAFLDSGGRVRIADAVAPNLNYFEGTVFSYNPSAPEMVILVDKVVGSGTKTAWVLTVTGDTGTAGTPGADGADGDTGPAGPTGSGGTYGTATHTTASMADDASVSESFVDIGKTFEISKVTVDKECRLRFYRNSAFATADASRPIGTAPEDNSGLVFEHIFTTGDLSRYPVKNPKVVNAESPRTNDTAILVTNLSGGTTAIQIDLEVLVTEV